MRLAEELPRLILSQLSDADACRLVSVTSLQLLSCCLQTKQTDPFCSCQCVHRGMLTSSLPATIVKFNQLQKRDVLTFVVAPDNISTAVDSPQCLGSMEAILSLPMVLLHRDFGTGNIMADGISCHLTGIIDWAEAEICPFGQNLQALTDALHLKNG